ncbi:MAG: hypothetical protein LBI03_02410 [Clostridiales bacterium]|jgi:hypothetical protein|nr:hypothetical protein [Clostridiales bacterium]
MEKKEKISFMEICKWMGLSLLFIGAAARIYLYIYCKDMWLDEAALAASIWEGDIKNILSGKLIGGQSAPLGFMLLTKFISYFGGTSEFALRFLPLMSGITSGFLLWVFARREVNEIYALLCAVIFVACIPLLYYASEFKPYATDTLVTIAYLFIYSKNLDSLYNNIMPLTTVFLSCLCLLFSLPGLFVFCGLASSVLIMAWKRGEILYFIKNNKYKILFMLAFVSIHVLYLWKTSNPGMFLYWERYFLPINPAVFPQYIKTVLAPIMILSMRVSESMFLNISILACSFFGGLFLLYRKNFPIFLFVFMTGLFFVAASAMKFYPLGHGGIIGSRLSLFYFPLIFISISYFFYMLYGVIFTKRGFLILSLIITLFLMKYQYNFVNHGGTQLQQVSNLIKTINVKMDYASEIIVYNMSVPAYKYYQHRHNKNFEYFVIGLHKDPIVELQQIAAEGKEKGKNTYYVLFSHYSEAHYESCVEYVRRTYDFKEILEAPGARLVVFKIINS